MPISNYVFPYCHLCLLYKKALYDTDIFSSNTYIYLKSPKIIEIIILIKLSYPHMVFSLFFIPSCVLAASTWEWSILLRIAY